MIPGAGRVEDARGCLLSWSRDPRYRVSTLCTAPNTSKRATFETSQIRSPAAMSDCAKGMRFLSRISDRPRGFGASKMSLHGRLSGEVSTSSVLSDILLFFCMAAFVTGIVLAVASLL
jgi:hypothetical protein